MQEAYRLPRSKCSFCCSVLDGGGGGHPYPVLMGGGGGTPIQSQWGGGGGVSQMGVSPIGHMGTSLLAGWGYSPQPDGVPPCRPDDSTPPFSWMGVPPGVDRQTDTGENITFPIPSECGR